MMPTLTDNIQEALWQEQEARNARLQHHGGNDIAVNYKHHNRKGGEKCR